jgi:fumarate hydratase class II
MLVTALFQRIGDDRAAKISKETMAKETALKEAAVSLGEATEEQSDEWIIPRAMVAPHE